MEYDDEHHLRLFDENMSQVETPLITTSSVHYPTHQQTAIYPYNLTGFHTSAEGKFIDQKNNYFFYSNF